MSSEFGVKHFQPENKRHHLGIKVESFFVSNSEHRTPNSQLSLFHRIPMFFNRLDGFVNAERIPKIQSFFL